MLLLPRRKTGNYGLKHFSGDFAKCSFPALGSYDYRTLYFDAHVSLLIVAFIFTYHIYLLCFVAMVGLSVFFIYLLGWPKAGLSARSEAVL